jgi:tyrosyl-tRNA synthetase
LADFSARENIKKRLDAGKRVSLREMLYPLMQGYDSVAVRADVELGGTDQRFNLLAGRHIQPIFNQEPQNIITCNLILGLDGRKMSSSWGNTINVTEAPNDMFGKAMRLSDDLIITYLEHCTRVAKEEVERIESDLKDGKNPRDAKVFLAKALVELYHGAEAALAAEEFFVSTFSQGVLPDDVPDLIATSGAALLDVIVSDGLALSNSDARRKIEQGGVSIDGEKITDPKFALDATHSGKILKVGKKDFRKLVI